MRISDWSSDVCSSDLNQFRPIGDRGQLSALRDRYEIPSGRYLIGSFQRDSVASDLVSPKLVKGPDVFCEIIRQAMDLGAPVHVVLAGPRRTWIRRRLQARSEEHTSELQSLMRISYAVFCLK